MPQHFMPKVPAGLAAARQVHKRAMLAQIEKRLRRRRKGGDGKTGGEPCPVEPNRPLDLSGGAAAALEFDD